MIAVHAEITVCVSECELKCTFVLYSMQDKFEGGGSDGGGHAMLPGRERRPTPSPSMSNTDIRRNGKPCRAAAILHLLCSVNIKTKTLKQPEL